MANLGGSNFLKPDQVEKGDVIIFEDEGKWTPSQKFTYPDGNPRQDFIITVTHNEKKKQMRLNKTNRDILKEKFKIEDGKDLIGKQAKLSLTKTHVGMSIVVDPEEQSWDEEKK